MKDDFLLTEEQIAGLTFEQALEKLEFIVNLLETNEVPLEEAIDLFQDGMRLAKRCHNKLENIGLKIDTLLEKDGELITKPFAFNDGKE